MDPGQGHQPVGNVRLLKHDGIRVLVLEEAYLLRSQRWPLVLAGNCNALKDGTIRSRFLLLFLRDLEFWHG